MVTLCAAAALLLSSNAASDPPSVEEILKKVAESQSSAQAARARVVYTQYVHARLLHSDGKLAREEKRTYTVTPTAKAFARKLNKLEGCMNPRDSFTPTRRTVSSTKASILTAT